MGLADKHHVGEGSEPNGSTAPQSAGLSLIAELVRVGGEAIREISARLRNHGAPQLRDILVLEVLSQHLTEGVRTTRLAAQTGMTTSRLAYRLRSLESAGLTRRAPHARDGRGVVVTITKRGMNELERALGVLAQVNGGSALIDPTASSAAAAAHAVLTGGQPLDSVVASFAQSCLAILRSTGKLEDAFTEMVDALSALMPLESAILWVADRDGLQLFVAAITNKDFWPIALEGVSVPVDSALLATQAFRQQRQILLGTPDEVSGHYPAHKDFYSSFGMSVGSRFDIPFSDHRSPLGVITGASSKQNPFGDCELGLLEVLTQVIGLRVGSEAPTLSPSPVPFVGTDWDLTETERAILDGIVAGIDPKITTRLVGLDDRAAQSALARLAEHLDLDDPAGIASALQRIQSS